MINIYHLIFGYLLIVNALGLAFMCLDKHFARKHRRRIPEATLMLSAAIGGSIGSWLGMYLVRHKTKHLKFVIGIPLILTAQVALVWLLVTHF